VPKANLAAEEHLAALERLNKMAEGFAAMVSHESRTALTGIQGLSELIRDGGLTPEETREYAQYIFQDAERVNRMISDLLDLNHLETARTQLRRGPVDINRVITETAQPGQYDGESQRVTLRLGQALPRVGGDFDRLTQVMTNLLRFARRNSSPGAEIVVTSIDLNDQVEVSVQAGSFRSIDFNDWLIGRYERYETRPSQIIGVGLGLAIARAIVELHGGRIWVHEEGGREPEFHFLLPAL
jgi:two-component system sensor histidine kinase ResE